MELKLVERRRPEEHGIRSNCTFMELKSKIDIKKMKKNEF